MSNFQYYPMGAYHILGVSGDRQKLMKRASIANWEFVAIIAQMEITELEICYDYW